MHEITAVRSAIEREVERAGGCGRSSRVRITVRDPARMSAENVRFYATELLRERGLHGVSVTLSVECAHCALCTWAGLPVPNDPFCPRCGTPLPAIEGPAVTARLYPRRPRQCA